MGACAELGVAVLAEGIETRGENVALTDLGICLQHGYWFFRPAYEMLSHVPPERFARQAVKATSLWAVA